jgi:hypothetical protein
MRVLSTRFRSLTSPRISRDGLSSCELGSRVPDGAGADTGGVSVDVGVALGVGKVGVEGGGGAFEGSTELDSASLAQVSSKSSRMNPSGCADGRTGISMVMITSVFGSSSSYGSKNAKMTSLSGRTSPSCGIQMR